MPRKAETANNLQTGTRAITRALEVLCCFSSAKPEWGISEMAEDLGYSRSVIHRILSTLEFERFVERTEARRYRLGTRALLVGQTSRVSNRLIWEAEPRLDALANSVKGVAHLGILEGSEVVELARSTTRRLPMGVERPHFRMPAHATALGKVLLAYSPPHVRERYFSLRRSLRRFTEKTICSTVELNSHIQTVLTQGYAMDDEECKLGYRCVAIPVYDTHGSLIAALSVSKKKPFPEEAETYHMLKSMLITARDLALPSTGTPL